MSRSLLPARARQLHSRAADSDLTEGQRHIHTAPHRTAPHHTPPTTCTWAAPLPPRERLTQPPLLTFYWGAGEDAFHFGAPFPDAPDCHPAPGQSSLSNQSIASNILGMGFIIARQCEQADSSLWRSFDIPNLLFPFLVLATWIQLGQAGSAPPSANQSVVADGSHNAGTRQKPTGVHLCPSVVNRARRKPTLVPGPQLVEINNLS